MSQYRHKLRRAQAWFHGFVILIIVNCVSAQSFRLEPDRNGVTIGEVAQPGALFIYRAPDLNALEHSPTVAFQTNTPETGFWLPVASGNQEYFFAVHWPGRSVEQFGDPEYSVDEPAPEAVLWTRGVSNLSFGEAYDAAFFLTDPLGRLLPVSGSAEIRVVRRSDGFSCPDVTVVPRLLDMTNGHAHALFTLQGEGSLEDCVIGIQLPSSSETIEATFNFGSDVVLDPSPGEKLQLLEDRRAAALDTNGWIWPIEDETGFDISGSYGEWRGEGNESVHEGVDLVLSEPGPVVACRSGVVSCRGTQHGKGDFLVVDHGDGWFSRYAHLERPAVAAGDIVNQGQTLSEALYSAPGWTPHLHFELRKGTGDAQWNVAFPGISHDPFQTAGFSVDPRMSTPKFEFAGLTTVHPGESAFENGVPDPNLKGAAFVVAKFTEPRSGNRIGLRRMSFHADGMERPIDIFPTNKAAIDLLQLPGSGASAGFARYHALHAARPDPRNYYRYWWKWDTALYADAPKGPRGYVLLGESYSGAVCSNTFSFGPEIKDKVWQPLGNQRFEITIVAHLGSSEEGLAQLDQYKLELITADRTVVPGVEWQGLSASGLTTLFSNHLGTQTYMFRVPRPEMQTNMVLRVSSVRVPDIADEVSQGVVFLASRYTNAPPLVDVPPGSFLMGSDETELERSPWEGPRTYVTISRAFKISASEITQAQYQSLMSTNPSYFAGHATRPVEQVSWLNAMDYCSRLTAFERENGWLPPGWAYRLPTEAEWEYACRAGTVTAFYYGTDLRSGMANFDGTTEYISASGQVINPEGVVLWETAPVASYPPNAWGLYDMHGNVWEWCLDWWDFSLPGGCTTDPQGPPAATARVIRGGCWYNGGGWCRAACRLSSEPGYRGNDIGFRIVLAPE